MKNAMPLHADDPIQRMDKIASSAQPTNVKAILLMQQAFAVVTQNKEETTETAPDLFSGLPKRDPLQVCMTHFAAVIKPTGNKNGFDPTRSVTIEGCPMSALNYAHVLSKDYGKKYPALKVFEDKIVKAYPKHVLEANKIEQLIRQEEKSRPSKAKKPFKQTASYTGWQAYLSR